MPEFQTPATRFEEHRAHLVTVATRLLGSSAEAEDAVQETWLRFDRANNEEIENPGGWLTTVVSRICLDHLRSRSTRREEPADIALLEYSDLEPGPEDLSMRAESAAEALAVVLDILTPGERVALVLHDVFDVPFDEIATIVDRTPTATRQMASRARQRVRTRRDGIAYDQQRHRLAVEAFLRASAAGDLHSLVAVLHPDAVLRADQTVLRMGSRNGWITSELHGASEVADQFNGRAQAAQLATIDGRFGAVWITGGKPRVAFLFTVEQDSVVAIELVADPGRLASLSIVPKP